MNVELAGRLEHSLLIVLEARWSVVTWILGLGALTVFSQGRKQRAREGQFFMSLLKRSPVPSGGCHAQDLITT